jgi:hypothetical protein
VLPEWLSALGQKPHLSEVFDIVQKVISATLPKDEVCKELPYVDVSKGKEREAKAVQVSTCSNRRCAWRMVFR